MKNIIKNDMVEKVSRLLSELSEQNFPDGFDDGFVTIKTDGENAVFVNKSGDIAALDNNGWIERFYITVDGRKGFKNELKDQYLEEWGAWSREDVQYLRDIGLLIDVSRDDLVFENCAMGTVVSSKYNGTYPDRFTYLGHTQDEMISLFVKELNKKYRKLFVVKN